MSKITLLSEFSKSSVAWQSHILSSGNKTRTVIQFFNASESTKTKKYKNPSFCE
jgi:hypothetical protein